MNNEQDFILMLAEIYTHISDNGNHILSYDNPKQLKFGWMCSKTEKIWEFSISKYKIQKIPNEIFRIMSTPVERSMMFLPEHINIVHKAVERHLKLKAFW